MQKQLSRRTKSDSTLHARFSNTSRHIVSRQAKRSLRTKKQISTPKRNFSMKSDIPSMNTTHPTTDTMPHYRHIESQAATQTESDANSAPKHPNRPLKIAFFGASDITPAVFDAVYAGISPESPINKDSDRGYPLIDGIDVITSPPVTRLLKGKRVIEDSPLMAHVKAKYPDVSVSHFSPDKATPFRTHYELEREKGYYDLAIVFSFPRLIPPRLIEQFSMGMINIHPSLIPLYRGPSPMQASLEHNDLESGVSIITIAPHKFDVGQVIAQRKFPIPESLTLAQMTPIVQSVGSEILIDLIDKWDQIRPHAVSQDTIMSHYTSSMAPEYLAARHHAPKYGSTISPVLETQTGKEIYGLWRGLVGFRQIHAKVQGKPKVDKKTGEISYKEPARIIFAEMALDQEQQESQTKGQTSGEDGKQEEVHGGDATTTTATTPDTASSRPHLYYDISEFQPGPDPGDAIFDPHLNAIRVRCAKDTTVLVSKFLSPTGQNSDAKALVNGQFTKELGKFRGKFITHHEEEPTKL